MIAMIAIGIQRPGDGRNATTDNSFYKAFIAVTNIVFAFGMSLRLAFGDTANSQIQLYPNYFDLFIDLLRRPRELL